MISETDLRVCICFGESAKSCEIRNSKHGSFCLLAEVQKQSKSCKASDKDRQRDSARSGASNPTTISIRYRRCATLSNYKYWIGKTKYIENRYVEQTS